MSYTNIASAIVSKMETITEINQVYDHEPKELAEYPAITVSSAGHENVFNDTSSNRRVFIFNIRCYVRADDVSAAETLIRSMADKIIEKIESDVTIGGSCDFARPSKGKVTYPPREIPVQAIEITVEAVKRVTR